MGKYIFENENKTPLEKCTGEEMKTIVHGVGLGHAEFFNGIWYEKNKSGPLGPLGVYRVRAVPNQIDWPEVPPRFKYCFVNAYGQGLISVKLPLERERPDEQSVVFVHSGIGGDTILINEGDYGFKRGTVESIDSLLIRPIGE